MKEPSASAHLASCCELDLPCSFVPSFRSQQTTDWQRGMNGGPALPCLCLRLLDCLSAVFIPCLFEFFAPCFCDTGELASRLFRNIYSTLGHRDSNLRNFTSGRMMHLFSGLAFPRCSPSKESSWR